MSLINKMLQDLEARSTDGAGVHAIHGQVRAVSAPRHASGFAWWIAGGLAVLLLAVLTMFWLRRPSVPPAPIIAATQVPVSNPAPGADRTPDLSLKLASDLSNVPSFSLPGPIPQDKAPGAVAEAIAAPLKQTDTTPALATDTKAAAHSSPGASIASQQPVAEKTPAAVAAPAAARPAAASPPAEAASGAMTKQVKELTPKQRAENDYRRATGLVQQGKTAEAIDALEQSLSLDPLNAPARQTLVGLLLESKRQDDAIRKLRDGLGLDPNQPGFAMLLARLQVDRNELPAAVGTLQRTLPHAAEHADYRAFLAALLQRQANHKEAVEQYQAALRKMPQNGLWWMGLGISLQAESRMQEAREAYSRAKTSNNLSAELQAFVEQNLRQMQN